MTTKTGYASMSEARAEYLRRGYNDIENGYDSLNRLYRIMANGKNRVCLVKTGFLAVYAREYTF